ncbi:hypothetical protein [Aquimarina aquimarini]|uniref:hypothetical protein n=1 Tax=Aquimarina aquimarini TaxID=1191734 RepID=UPI000D552D28|nr:hypothetical protein [Aquimarina aquimarini]
MFGDMPPKVFYGLLNALDIDIGNFVTALLNDEPKEINILIKMYAIYEVTKDTKLVNKTKVRDWDTSP